MHDRKIVHRDLKMSKNILLSSSHSDDEIKVKIRDFFNSSLLQAEKFHFDDMDITTSAPELLEGNKDIDEKVDVWSVGAIAFILTHQNIPYNMAGNISEEATKTEVAEFIRKEELILDSGSAEARDFISKCLAKNSQDRPTVEQLLKHPWIEEWVKDP
jgi:serine/threonine protein kinase